MLKPLKLLWYKNVREFSEFYLCQPQWCIGTLISVWLLGTTASSYPRPSRDGVGPTKLLAKQVSSINELVQGSNKQLKHLVNCCLNYNKLLVLIGKKKNILLRRGCKRIFTTEKHSFKLCSHYTILGFRDTSTRPHSNRGDLLIRLATEP